MKKYFSIFNNLKYYDRTFIIDYNYKKYHKTFNSIENIYVVDINKITLVFIFDDKPTFLFKKNYQLINQEIITNKDKIKILGSITNSKISFWNKENINKDYDNYKWILKLEYYNRLSEYFNEHDMIHLIGMYL